MFRLHRRMFSIATLMAVGIAMSWMGEAKADIAYRLRFNIAGPVTVDPNSVQALSVFLEETVTGADTHLIGSSFNGNQVGVFISDYRATVSGTGISNVVMAAGSPAEFDFTNTDDTQNPLLFWQNAVVLNAPVVGSVIGSTRQVEVGTLAFNVGNSGSTTISLADFDLGGASDDIVIGDGLGGLFASLDNALNMSYDSITLNINAVPEPSSMALAGIAGSAGVFYFWRRRRSNAV